MSSHTRQKKIMDLVQRSESLKVDELVERLQVSPATVRRDLVWLEEEGKVIRLRGAVMDRRSVQSEPSFLTKRGRVPEEKRRIGQLAAEQIPPGAVVFVDAGTTCLEAGIALVARGSHTIYTNSLPLMMHGGNADSRIVAIGGEVRELTGALVGSMALEWIRHLRFDYSIVGASALDADHGVMTTELNEAGIKRAIIESSAVSILAADYEKLGDQTTVQFAEWENFQFWVTNKVGSHAKIRSIKRRKGLNILQTA
jgi:DeoR family fructose operon transcriptional repressor